MDNIASLIEQCQWLESKFLVFSDNVFNSLIYYSHFSVLLIAALVILILFNQLKKSEEVRWLVFTLLALSVWVFSDLVLWATEFPRYTMFFWTILIIFESLIYFGTAFFTYSFLKNKKVPFWHLYVATLIVLPTIILAPSVYGLLGFDITNCDRAATEGWLPMYGYSSQFLFVIYIVCLGVTSFFRTRREKRIKAVLITGSSILFLTAFSLGNITEVVSENWTIGQYGLFGVPIFLGALTILIIKYDALNLKIISSEILVTIVSLAVMSLLFLTEVDDIRVVATGTLIMIIFLGSFLVRGVKKEVLAREENERLAHELNSTNENLEHANARLKELDALKSEFVSLASHQMRGPLGAIKGYVSLISEGELGEASDQVRDAADKVSQATNSLMIMVEDFLNVSRIQQGRMKYVFKKINLVTFVEEAVLEMKPSIEAKKLSLTLTLGTDPVYVEADEAHLKQVCINLIDNAIKYTSEGGITVTITKHVAEGKVRVRFTDTGVGISPDMKDRLFQKFSRAKEASQVNAGGTGLGLYVAKEMMRAHKGSIWIESFGKGKGATFVVELPLKA